MNSPTDKPEVRVELEACPWCGGKPEITKHFKFEMYGLVHRCQVMPSIVMDFADPGYNEAKWNTRIPQRGEATSEPDRCCFVYSDGARCEVERSSHSFCRVHSRQIRTAK